MSPTTPQQGMPASASALSIGQTGLYPQFIFFGDSITQKSSLTLQLRLQELYVRKADVVNRGFSGYTASLGLSILPKFLPSPSSGPSPSPYHPPIRLLTIFFGANDACLPGNPQHIPLATYVDSLRDIIGYPVFKQHGTKIILITPAPVDEWQLEKPITRTAINAWRYARAARHLAEDLGLPCIDLWTAFMKASGYTPPPDDGSLEQLPPTSALQPAKTLLPGSLSTAPNTRLADLLIDGIHFTPQGYDVLYDELIATINHSIPECMPENMPLVFRDWKDILGVTPRQAERAEPGLHETETETETETEIETGAGSVKTS